MYVGVILQILAQVRDKYGVPHVCGGDPMEVTFIALLLLCSPCMWG